MTTRRDQTGCDDEGTHREARDGAPSRRPRAMPQAHREATSRMCAECVVAMDDDASATKTGCDDEGTHRGERATERLRRPRADASSTSRATSRADVRERPRAARWRETRESERLSLWHGRARARFRRMTRRARGRHSGAARVRGAPCATSRFLLGRGAPAVLRPRRNTSRGTCGVRHGRRRHCRSRLIRDATRWCDNYCPPPNDPPSTGAPRRARPSNRRGSRPDGGGVARGGGRARALSPAATPTDAPQENRRGGRARGDPRDERPAHRPATFRRPTGTARQPRRLGARSARAPRAASSPPPSLFAATRARQLVHQSRRRRLRRSRARARSPLVGHLSIERWGAHVAVIPVREHPDDPAPTALVLAGSKGLRSRARAHALSTRGSVPDRWGHAHTVLSPIVHPRALAFPLSGQPSLREELTRVSLLPWSVARALGIDGFLPPDAREPEGFASRVALTSRLESGAFGGYVSLRVASNLDPERAFLCGFTRAAAARGSVAGSSSRTIFDAAASPRTGRIVAGTDAGVASFRPWIDASRTGRPEIFCRCDSSVTAVAADVSFWSDPAGAGGGRGAAEVIAAGTRNGGISLVDTRDARRCVRDGGGRMTSLVCDLAAVRSHPGHLLAASADGGLARWDVRRASEPVTTYRAGSTTATFCGRDDSPWTNRRRWW